MIPRSTETSEEALVFGDDHQPESRTSISTTNIHDQSPKTNNSTLQKSVLSESSSSPSVYGNALEGYTDIDDVNITTCTNLADDEKAITHPTNKKGEKLDEESDPCSKEGSQPYFDYVISYHLLYFSPYTFFA